MDRAVEGLGSDSVEGRWPDAESDAAFELMVESVVRDCPAADLLATQEREPGPNSGALGCHQAQAGGGS